jgi:hypothetical protein
MVLLRIRPFRGVARTVDPDQRRRSTAANDRSCETSFGHRGSSRDRDDHPQHRCDRIRRVRLASRLRVQREDLSRPVAFVEELSARRKWESEQTALPFFPYNQLQLGFSLLLPLPPAFSGDAVVGVRAYCR